MNRTKPEDAAARLRQSLDTLPDAVVVAAREPERSRKRRRARGSGSVFLKGRVWWIAYHGPDGKRHAESTESERKGDAERRCTRQCELDCAGCAREHN